MFIILYMKSLTKGVWMSNPYPAVVAASARGILLGSFLSHEKARTTCPRGGGPVVPTAR